MIQKGRMEQNKLKPLEARQFEVFVCKGLNKTNTVASEWPKETVLQMLHVTGVEKDLVFVSSKTGLENKWSILTAKREKVVRCIDSSRYFLVATDTEAFGFAFNSRELSQEFCDIYLSQSIRTTENSNRASVSFDQSSQFSFEKKLKLLAAINFSVLSKEELLQLEETVQAVSLKMKKEQERRKGEENQDCCICLENKKDVVFNPCGHYVCCTQCSSSLNICPLCRTKIDGKIKVYS